MNRGMGDSHIQNLEYHAYPLVVKVITCVVLGLSRVATHDYLNHSWVLHNTPNFVFGNNIP